MNDVSGLDLLENPMDFKAKEFSCPHCGFNTKHRWYYLAKGGISERGFNYYVGFVSDLHLSLCHNVVTLLYG